MKYTTIIVLVFVLVVLLTAKKTSRKHKRKKNKLLDAILSDDEGLPVAETKPNSSNLFDLNGTLKKTFALEAASVNPNKNVICSPLSAWLPLGKLVLGTDRGPSRMQLLDAIGVPQNVLKRRFREMLDELSQLPGVTLSIASRLFVSKKFDLNARYLEVIRAIFTSSLEKMDFHSKIQSADRINSWVNKQTQGMIPNIISPEAISKDTSLLLVNAIYFSGHWENTFPDVNVGDFHTPAGTRRVPLMMRRGRYNFVESQTLNSKIVEIPYGGSNVSLIIVLPSNNNGLPVLLSELKVAPELLNVEMEKMAPIMITLTIPKFKIESDLDLKHLYEKVGIKNIFIPNESGLDRITMTEQVHISSAKQKCFIEVTETGTDAAAVSSVGISATSFMVINKAFIANHPFLFFVKAKREQLFAGIFNSP